MLKFVWFRDEDDDDDEDEDDEDDDDEDKGDRDDDDRELFKLLLDGGVFSLFVNWSNAEVEAKASSSFSCCCSAELKMSLIKNDEDFLLLLDVDCCRWCMIGAIAVLPFCVGRV